MFAHQSSAAETLQLVKSPLRQLPGRYKRSYRAADKMETSEGLHLSWQQRCGTDDPEAAMQVLPALSLDICSRCICGWGIMLWHLRGFQAAASRWH